MLIFYGMVDDTIEVFMDKFYVAGESFNDYLAHLANALCRCEKCNLVLNWEKFHFILKEGIVLEYKISKKGIEVDKEKIEVR